MTLESRRRKIKRSYIGFPVAEAYEALETSERGLSGEQVAERLNQYGKNILREAKGKPLIVKLLANFTHLMAIPAMVWRHSWALLRRCRSSASRYGS